MRMSQKHFFPESHLAKIPVIVAVREIVNLLELR